MTGQVKTQKVAKVVELSSGAFSTIFSEILSPLFPDVSLHTDIEGCWLVNLHGSLYLNFVAFHYI